MINYLTYPTADMNITQNYSDGYSHAPHSQGSPADYPIDEGCSDSGRDWFYCPCDEMVVARIYGVGTAGTNTVWLSSTSKVHMPCGEDFVTIQVIHPNDDTLSGLSVGQKFHRGDRMFLEGDDGNATGYHFHIAVGIGESVGSGWTQNSQGVWVNQTSGKQLKPEEAFWIDDAFTTVKNDGGIAFRHLSTEPEVVPEATPAKNDPQTQEAAKDDAVYELIYRVQIGAFRDFQNAVSLALDAGKKGFEAAIVPYLKGDVDNDGKVTPADARLALRIATGLE